MSDLIAQLAAEAARRGGEAIRAVADRPRAITHKGFRDDVTDADYAAQEAIFAALRTHHPDWPIVSEEQAGDLSAWTPPAGLWWVVDPLDGTSNFSHKIPHYCVSVAALQGETIIAGAIYDPVRDHLFAAAQGQGATFNSAPMHVSPQADPADAILDSGLARGREQRRYSLALYQALATDCRTVRSLGSAALALAYVAAGWVDGYFHLTLSPWDCAAGVLLIREAGGTVTLPDGGAWSLRQGGLLASNGLIHAALVDISRAALARVNGPGA